MSEPEDRRAQRQDDEFRGYVRAALESIQREGAATRADVHDLRREITAQSERHSGKVGEVHKRVDGQEERLAQVEIRAAKVAGWAAMVGIILGAIGQYLVAKLFGRA